MPLEVVVLAADHGKRMHSRIPKVFHTLLGKPILVHVLDTVRSAGSKRIHVVIRPEMQLKATKLVGDNVCWVHQLEPRGDGQALHQALPHIAPNSRVLVINGDLALITARTLEGVLAQDSKTLGIVSAEVQDPSGHCRLMRDSQNRVCGLMNDRNATPDREQINEVLGGVIAAPVPLLQDLLVGMKCQDVQEEQSLTDIVAFAAREGVHVSTARAASPDEVIGIDDRIQLARSERTLADRKADELMANGVTLKDPSRFDLRGSLAAGMDCSIDINAIVEGEVVLGDDVHVGPGCILRDVKIGNGVRLHEYCIVDSATIGDRCTIGPLARIRPRSVLEEDVRIGNFVEVKASTIGKGTRAGHLAYIGDADVGQEVNVGAGAITCNFDGASKHRTVIGDNVFIGTNCTMVAPLTIESGAFLAAGSTITSDVTGDVLAVGRARQRIISRWISPRKRKKA